MRAQALACAVGLALSGALLPACKDSKPPHPNSPEGALYHYPIKGGDQKAGVVCSPAPPLIAAQIWAQAIQAQMIVRHFKGDPIQKVCDWAAMELEGFKRT